MAKNIFEISTSLTYKKRTIKETSKILIKLFSTLAQNVDEIFYSFTYVKDKIIKEFNINSKNIDEAIGVLCELILKSYKIKRFIFLKCPCLAKFSNSVTSSNNNSKF